MRTDEVTAVSRLAGIVLGGGTTPRGGSPALAAARAPTGLLGCLLIGTVQPSPPPR
jgi:hypothetical protein